jgi:hypothetical protein
MQAEETFPGNTVGAKAADLPKICRSIKPIQGLRQLIGEGDWAERFHGCEKYINRFSWAIIIASVIYLIPVCINILIR